MLTLLHPKPPAGLLARPPRPGPVPPVRRMRLLTMAPPELVERDAGAGVFVRTIAARCESRMTGHYFTWFGHPLDLSRATRAYACTRP